MCLQNKTIQLHPPCWLKLIIGCNSICLATNHLPRHLFRRRFRHLRPLAELVLWIVASLKRLSVVPLPIPLQARRGHCTGHTDHRILALSRVSELMQQNLAPVAGMCCNLWTCSQSSRDNHHLPCHKPTAFRIF